MMQQVEGTGKTALLIGATGLVGKALLMQLLDDPSYGRVHVFARRSIGLTHPKLNWHNIDFDQPDQWKPLLKGDVLFSALGTTLKQAGSKEAQYKVDYTYQMAFARAAAQNGVAQLVLVSSVGADAKSGVFYTRMKGELDRDLRALAFARITILRPGPLVGPRENPRAGEGLLKGTMAVFNAVGLFMKYKPISGDQVAESMRKVVEKQQAQAYSILEPKAIFKSIGISI